MARAYAVTIQVLLHVRRLRTAPELYNDFIWYPNRCVEFPKMEACFSNSRQDDDGQIIASKVIVYGGEPEEYYSFITSMAYRSLKEWMDFGPILWRENY